MLNNNSIIAIIPARGGSKGIPKKNIRDIGGKPLIAWTIEEAKKSKYIDRLILSSDNAEIIKIAQDWGCEVPFVRPHELAQDKTPGIAPVIHAISALKEKYDYVMLLQPTSPLRKVEDIDNCIEFCLAQRAAACVAVTEADESPYWMYAIEPNSRCLRSVLTTEEKYVRRQDLPKAYIVNGALYFANIEWFLESKAFLTKDTIAYVMPRDRSIDIDCEQDIKVCEGYLRRS